MSQDDKKAMWARYVKSVAGDLGTGIAISKHIKSRSDGLGPSQPTVARWLTGAYSPTGAAEVALLARAFDRNPIEAFVAAGMLTLEEARKALTSEEVDRLKELASEPDVGRPVTPIKLKPKPSAPRRTVRDTSKLVAKRSSEAAGAPREDGN